MTGGRLRRVVTVVLLGLGSSVQCPSWGAGTGLHWSPGGGTPSGAGEIWGGVGPGKWGSLLGAVCLRVGAGAEASSEIAGRGGVPEQEGRVEASVRFGWVS